MLDDFFTLSLVRLRTLYGLQEDDRGLLVVHRWHRLPYSCPDIGWVAYSESFARERDVVAMVYVGQMYCLSQVARIIDQDDLQPQQVAYQMGEQDGTVFAVAIGIVERLLAEESPVFASPYLVIVGIVESCLHPVEQTFHALYWCEPLQLSAHLRIKLSTEMHIHRGVGIHRPSRHEVLVDGRTGIGFKKADDLTIDGESKGEVGIAFGGDRALRRVIVAEAATADSPWENGPH